MYIESRTTPAEVLDDVFAELRAMANASIADARTRRLHPSYITVTSCRTGLDRLNGALQLAAKVAGGADRLPIDVLQLIADARRDVDQAVAK